MWKVCRLHDQLPNRRIVEEGIIDARRCISYLTIEFDGIIPEELREPIGNRIYGCDDCQLVCPFNRFSDITEEVDYHCRDSLYQQPLHVLYQWSEQQFLKNTEGSAIRRIGHIQWLRNLTIAMGNAPYHPDIYGALEQRLGDNELLDIHIQWAIGKQQEKRQESAIEVLPGKTKRLIRIVEKGLPRDA